MSASFAYSCVVPDRRNWLIVVTKVQAIALSFALSLVPLALANG
ncbi:hypothetical protein [Erythrobacter sp. Alg231-14]